MSPLMLGLPPAVRYDSQVPGVSYMLMSATNTVVSLYYWFG